MPTFEEISKELEKLNPQQALKKAVESSKVSGMLTAIIKRRLETQGVTGDNTLLKTDQAQRQPGAGFYSRYTKILKQQKGQTISHVTLKDSGEFYRSFKTEMSDVYFEISANFQKEDGNIYENFTKQYPNEQSFENAITSLTEIELNEFLKIWIIEDVRKNLKEQI